MGVFTAQPFSILLASTLLAAGFALLGTVLLLFVCVYRSADRLLVQRVLVGGGWRGRTRADAIREQRRELPCHPRVQSDAAPRDRSVARPAAPSRAPPIRPDRHADHVDRAAATTSHGSVPGTRSLPRPGPDPS